MGAVIEGVEILPPGAGREEWLEARRIGEAAEWRLGASEISAAMGICPPEWGSPFSLYWQKKLNMQGEMSEAMEWGLRHEPAIAAKFAENHPEFDVRVSGLYRHGVHGWMVATPDRLLFEQMDTTGMRAGGSTGVITPPTRAVALAQFKTASSVDGWGEPGTDDIPVYYKAQIIWEQDVYGADLTHVAVLFRGNMYREYVVGYDADDAKVMREAGAEFVQRLVDGNPPRIDGSAATTHTLKALHPSLIDEPVTVDTSLADMYWQRKQLLADAQAAYDEATNLMLEAIGDYRFAVADGRKVAYRSVYEKKGFDVKQFRADEPDLYAQYETRKTVNALYPAKEPKQ